MGSGPACLWGNRLIGAHSSPGNSLECALWVSCTAFFSFSSTRCLHSRAPGKVPLQKGMGGGAQVDGPYYTNLKLFHFLRLTKAEENIHLTHRVLSFCLMALQNINLIFMFFWHKLHIWRLSSAVQHTTYFKWCLERNNGGAPGNSSACDASQCYFRLAQHIKPQMKDFWRWRKKKHKSLQLIYKCCVPKAERITSSVHWGKKSHCISEDETIKSASNSQ